MLGPIQDLTGGFVHGHAADLQRPGTASDAALAHHVGVAVDDLDVLHGNAEPVGDEHGPSGDVALAVGRGAGAGNALSVPLHLDAGELLARAAARYLDVHRQSDAEDLRIASLPTPLLLLS